MPEKPTLRDIVAHIQEYLLEVEPGFFVDGEALVWIITGYHDFCITNGIKQLRFEDVEGL